MIAVDRAVTGKYGQPSNGTMMFADGTSVNCRVWNTPKIQMSTMLPFGIPVGATPDYLHQKMPGVMELVDVELVGKLSREKFDAVQQEMLKNHDIEKIKANL